jgi:predicted nucleic-acid-binding Zn-ribbon protein
MSKRIHFHCNNCGYDFYAEVLTEEEITEYIKARKPRGQIHCPKCRSANLLRG